MKSKIIIIIAFLTLAVMSCKDNDMIFDPDEMNFRSVEFAAPIAKLHIPLYESIKEHMDFEELKKIDGIICIEYIYRDSIEWSDDITIVDIDNKLINCPFESEDWVDLEVEYTLSRSKTQRFWLWASVDDKDSYVNEAELSSGRLMLSFNHPPTLSSFTSYTITIRIPQLEKDGEEFTKTFYNQQPAINENLAEYLINTDNHEIEVICEYDLTSSTPLSGSLDLIFTLDQMEFFYLAGYFGNIKFNPFDGEMDFDFFDEFDFDGEVGIRGVTMKAEIVNSAGMPIYVEGEVEFTNEYNKNKSLELDPEFKLHIPPATKDNNNNIIPKKFEKLFTLSDDIEFNEKDEYPSNMSFEFIGEINKNSTPPIDGSSVDFVRKIENKNLVDIDLVFTVPFDFKLSYNRKDTVEFDYRNIVNDDEKLSSSVKDFTIFFLIDNGLPLEVKLKAYAINEAGNVKIPIDEIAIKVVNGVQSEKITLSQSILSQFWDNDVQNIVLETTANTKDLDYVKVKEDARLDIDLSVAFKSNIPVSF